MGGRARRSWSSAEIAATPRKAPVYAGDTVHVEFEVTKLAPSGSKPDRGVVTTHQRVRNQRGELVLEYDVKRMLKRRRPL